MCKLSGWFKKACCIAASLIIASTCVVAVPLVPQAEAAAAKKPARVKIASLKSARPGQVTVKVKKAKGAKGYQYLIALDKKFKTGKKTKTTAKKSWTFASLQEGSVYYAKARAFSKKGGKKLWGKWSKAKKVTVLATPAATSSSAQVPAQDAGSQTPQTPSADQQAAAKAAQDAGAAQLVQALIAKLPAASDANAQTKPVLDAVRAAYDALSDEQKALLAADVAAQLAAVESAVNDAVEQESAAHAEQAKRDQDIEKARLAIDAIGAVENTAECEALIASARASLDALLAEYPTASVPNVATLEQAESLLQQAKEQANLEEQQAADKAQARAAIEAIKALPAAADINRENAKQVAADANAALEAYNALTSAQQEMVSAAQLVKLAQAVAAAQQAGGAEEEPELSYVYVDAVQTSTSSSSTSASTRAAKKASKRGAGLENLFGLFICDSDKAPKPGESYQGGIVKSVGSAPDDAHYRAGSVSLETSVKFDDLFLPTLDWCVTIDLSMADVSNKGNLNNMFADCASLKDIDLSGWDTSNVRSMNYLFSGCVNLVKPDLTGWDVSNVVSMYRTFDGCTSLESINLAGWDTGNVTSMYGFFEGCSSLKSADVSNWNIRSIKNMKGFFESCTSLESIDLSSWTTGELTKVESMFDGCSSLNTLSLAGWDTSGVTRLNRTFEGCTDLETLDLSGWKTAGIKHMTNVFADCRNLQALDISGWDLTALEDRFKDDVVAPCTELATLKCANLKFGSKNMFGVPTTVSELVGEGTWDLSGCTDMSYVFAGCSELTEIDATNWDTSNVASWEETFSGCSQLSQIDTSKWNMSSATTLVYMFLWCGCVSTIDMTNWNLRGVASPDSPVTVDMSEMFRGCDCLQSVGDWSGWSGNEGLVVRAWDTFNLPALKSLKAPGLHVLCTETALFQGLSSLEELDVTGWVVSGWPQPLVENCQFSGKLDLSNWDVSGLRDFSGSDTFLNQFRNVTVSELDLSGWTVIAGYHEQPSLYGLETLTARNLNVVRGSNDEMMGVDTLGSFCADLAETKTIDVENLVLDAGYTRLYNMFANDSSLETLVLKGWDTSNITSFDGMLSGCDSLKSLTTGDAWTQAAAQAAGGATAMFPVAMTDEGGTAYAAGDIIPNGAHVYTAVA